MTGRSRIIAFGGSEEGHTEQESGLSAQAVEASEELAAAQEPAESGGNMEHEEEAAQRRSTGRVVAGVLAVAAGIAWTAFFVWAQLPRLAQPPVPAELASIVAEWSLPLLLICGLWLVAMRGSTREAERFGNTARLLSDESTRLESKLLTINRELSLAREFLASEARDLETLGRVASEKLSENAERLQELVRDNGTRVETIGTVSETALENMEKLRGQLPVIASFAKDVTNNIGNAGRTAHSQLEEMVKGFMRINDFGKACEAQILNLRGIVDDSLSRFSGRCSELENVAATRFAELDARGAEFHTQLERQEVEALAAIRSRASTLAQELQQARSQLIEEEEACLATLRSRISELRDEGEAISLAMRDGEAQAIANWRNQIEQIGQERSALFERIEQSDSDAIGNARNRLESIKEEARLIEEGIAERSARISETLAARRSEAENEERSMAARLGELLASLDEEIGERFATHQSQHAEIADHVDKVSARIRQSEERLGGIADRAQESEERIAAKLQEIAESNANAQSSLESTAKEVSDLTEASVRLLELIRASGDLSRDQLPQILKQSEVGLAASEARARELRDALKQAGKNGEWLTNQIDGSSIALNAILENITKMQFALRDQANLQKETLSSVAKSLTEIEEQSDRLSEKARSELSDAIATLGSSAREAVALISDESSTEIQAIADKLGTASAEALEKAMRDSANEATGQIEQAAAHAAGVGREATIQLRDQLGKVNELVSNLERRIVQARERAEEQVDNDFARRAALITEALNSNAIDIAKALSTDVSDTSWEGYLRGDRGIFTRRAVNLIEATDARAILQVFERDLDFREHVSRYIHDFEAILRQVLSTRDGHALGVTLLSSDMGKLYVALAQSIERLRS